MSKESFTINVASLQQLETEIAAAVGAAAAVVSVLQKVEPYLPWLPAKFVQGADDAEKLLSWLKSFLGQFGDAVTKP